MSRLDLLRLPGLRQFVRWRYSRAMLQLPLLILACLAVYDGLTGRQIAPVNVATVSVWVHYRGLAALALALFGNLFCAACPLMLTRGPSRLLARVLPTLSWPRWLRHKYGVLGLFLIFLFAYELFDLWASPWLTAWLIVVYFGSALLIDALFPPGTFCKYVCPLGNFNFALSGASPLIIAARDTDVCTRCEGKFCLTGRVETTHDRHAQRGRRAGRALRRDSSASQGNFPGCETDLFVPTIQSNADCTFCFNCVRACPYDNVALELRAPTQEASRIRFKPDWALFVTVLAWSGLVNAFAMTAPYNTFLQAVVGVFGHLGGLTDVFALVFVLFGGIALGVVLSSCAARLAGGQLRDWIMVFVPLALAAWGGHYLYHLVTGFSTLVPAVHDVLTRLGLPLGEQPRAVVPARDAAFFWQVVAAYLGFGASVFAILSRLRRQQAPRRALVAQCGLALLFVVLMLVIFAQPMEVRGGILA